MTNSNTGWGCRQISWLAAAIIGVVAAIILGVAAHWGWFLAILAGIVVAVIAGLILTYFFWPAYRGNRRKDRDRCRTSEWWIRGGAPRAYRARPRRTH